ncbi:MAG: histidine kinase [Acidobacteria bacterium]|nr:histidine kinase [Acidobacteriota bacterium]
MEILAANREILIALLVKLGIIASLASLLTRSQTFRKTLFAEERETAEKLTLIRFWGLPLCIGVVIRGAGVGSGTVNPFAAFDLSLEGTFIAGLLGGTLVGAIVGGCVGMVALLQQQEWAALALYPTLGLLSGLLRNLSPRKEEIWNFSPFVFINLVLSFFSRQLFSKSGWQLIFFFSCIGVETLRQALGQALTSTRLFYLPTDSFIVFVLILVASLSCVGVTLKVWNNTRLEIKLAEQEVLVVKARLDALANQINPHFLFNTLNSIASLVRSNPAKARATVLKLSHILRKLLQGHENFIPLREEVEFIDNYLDIEVSRFGKDKLRVEKEIDDRTLSCMIPSMILQPIIENSIRHGISPKIEGGRIRICSALQEERLCIQVADDGLGISNDKLSSIYHSGIGISNVLERLKVAYQTDFAFTVSSRPGEGTFTHIEIPLQESREIRTAGA